jgi:hypothetical protein
MLFPQNPEVAANLHTLAVHTVEQLATLTAHGVQTVGMGALQWQQKARQFLDYANRGASYHAVDAQNKKLQNQIETQANQIAQLKAQLDQLLAVQAGVPGTMVPQRQTTIAQQRATGNLQGSYRPNPPQHAAYPDGDADIAATNAGNEFGAPAAEFEQSDPFESNAPMSTADPQPTPAPKRLGWPKGKPRGPRKAA